VANRLDAADLSYSADHLWVSRDGTQFLIGFAPYIAHQIGDIQSYTLPDVGTQIVRGEVVAEIEAAKTLCEVAAPVTGTIAGVNPALRDNPSVIINHPYETWVLRVTGVNAADFEQLLSWREYEEYLEGRRVVHPMKRRFAPPEPGPFSPY
jgi:glycine cleavage system H protein